MGTYPTYPRAAFLQWCQAHAPVFEIHAAAIGLTQAQVNLVTTRLAAAASMLVAHEQARTEAQVATQKTVDSFRGLNEAVSKAVRAIRAYAESSPDPNAVYAIAQIPPPAPPAPTAPPGTPYKFTINLLPNGGLGIKWKCDNPQGTNGTIYEVRRAANAGPEALNAVGSTGKKTFVDETVPAGSATVLYEITAVRSTQRGTPTMFTVYFGVGAGGQRTMSFREGAPLDAAFNVELPAPRRNATVEA